MPTASGGAPVGACVRSGGDFTRLLAASGERKGQHESNVTGAGADQRYSVGYTFTRAKVYPNERWQHRGPVAWLPRRPTGSTEPPADVGSGSTASASDIFAVLDVSAELQRLLPLTCRSVQRVAVGRPLLGCVGEPGGPYIVLVPAADLGPERGLCFAEGPQTGA